MSEVARAGRTILFVSHNMAAIENLCSRCILLQDGAVTEIGPTDQIISQYLKKVMEPATERNELATRTDRSGSGAVILTDFHLEDANGDTVTAVQSGSDTVLAFTICNRQGIPRRGIDLGFSIHDSQGNQSLSVLYSSYQNHEFELIEKSGCIRCLLPHLPLAAGRYKVGARITVRGIEADWPQGGVGWLDVIEGDFFETGRKGFGNHAPFLMKGNWSFTNTGV